MKRTAVVVINFRTPQLTIDCLETLVDEIDPSQDLVVVVDNDSGDDSLARIDSHILQQGWQTWVKLLPSGRNGGFSFGNNVGIESVEAKFYLLLNSDTLVRPGALEAMRQAMQQRDDVGLVGPRLEWQDGTAQISCFRYRSPASELIVAASSAPVTRLFRKYEVPLRVSDEQIEPPWASFACILIRRDVIEQVGLMDDGYFMYFEDIDYCRRARKRGWKVLYEPSARVVHLRGGSSNVKDAIAERKRPPRFYYESRARYFAKFYGRTGLWFTNLLWAAGRTIELARVVITGRVQQTCQKESIDNWIDAWNPLRPKMSRSNESSKT